MALSRHDIVRIGLGEQDRLLAYIFAIVHDDHIAEDVFQETFALAVEKNERINDAEHFVRWLRVTARNKSKEALRTRANSPQLLDDAVIDSLESHWDAIDTEAHTAQIAALRHCMEQLTPNLREFVELRYTQGLTGKSLAEATGRSLNTVYTSVARAHRTLEKCIRARLADDAGMADPDHTKGASNG